MILKRRFLAAITTSAIAATVVLASAGVSEASTNYRFRLSQFATAVANLCVFTDATPPGGVCTTDWAGGRSEIFDVPADSLENWHCEVFLKNGPKLTIGPFSRVNTKECYIDGDYNRGIVKGTK